VLSDADRAALADARRDVESHSRVELVVTLRSRSAAYDRGPALAGAGIALAVSAVPGLERALATRARRREAVERAARASFVERGVGLTRERTGVLVYFSRLEREVVVVADKGVTDLVAPEAWREACAALERVAVEGGGTAALASALRCFGALLAKSLPRRADDVNELADDVQVHA
jgi:putative membrane protein